MTRTMRIELYVLGGVIDRELVYTGDSPEEIAQEIKKDENELLEYLETGDDRGTKDFCFAGFMFRKEGIQAARMSESIFEG